MKLRSGKRYKVESCWWYKYTIEACSEQNVEEDKEVIDLFQYKEHTIKDWVKKILPLYERVRM